MKWQSALAIYFLFWMFSVFLVIPFGVQTHDEAGAEKTLGQADSAPYGYSVRRTALRTTIVATALFAIFALNYEFGWVTPQTLDFLDPPAASTQG